MAVVGDLVYNQIVRKGSEMVYDNYIGTKIKPFAIGVSRENINCTQTVSQTLKPSSVDRQY